MAAIARNQGGAESAGVIRAQHEGDKILFLRALLLSLAVLVSACAGIARPTMTGGADNRPAVTGTASYRERIALPPDALIEVSLVDVSLMDVAAKLISRQTIRPEHAPPFAFVLRYDPRDIDERMTYAVQARIVDADGRLLFVTDTSYQVLTRGYPDRVDLVLKYIKR